MKHPIQTQRQLVKIENMQEEKEHTETNLKTRPWNAESLVTMFKLTPTQEERDSGPKCASRIDLICNSVPAVVITNAQTENDPTKLKRERRDVST